MVWATRSQSMSCHSPIILGAEPKMTQKPKTKRYGRSLTGDSPRAGGWLVGHAINEKGSELRARCGEQDVRIRTSHSSWLAKRCRVVHASGRGAAWYVSDCSCIVKKGLVRGAIGRSVASSEEEKWHGTSWHHTTEKTHTSPRRNPRRPNKEANQTQNQEK